MHIHITNRKIKDNGFDFSVKTLYENEDVLAPKPANQP
jgi:hypothetical protein